MIGNLKILHLKSMCRITVESTGELCKKPVTHPDEDLCTLHYNKLFKPTNPVQNAVAVGETKACVSDAHHLSGSKYPKDKVPLEDFRKPGKRAEKIHKNCCCCRNYITENVNNKRKMIALLAEQQNKLDTGFRVCQAIQHTFASKYPRNQVPKELFLKKTGDPNSFTEYCLDCRTYDVTNHEKSLEKKKEIAAKEGKFVCCQCKDIKSEEERATRLDGDPSCFCIPCYKDKAVENINSYEKWKTMFRNVQYERMLECQSCCEICNAIFLQPKEGTHFHITLSTTLVNGVRYVDYNGKNYQVKDFLIQFRDLIEFRIIDFDHLTEKELRERGILKPGEPFVGKSDNVSGIGSEYSLRQESRVCQIACCKCHLIETIKRERGDYKPCRKRKEKIDYINSLKRAGCSVCGYVNENLLRFFELDHLDPSTKIETIAHMVTSNEYSLEDVENECEGTRVLCRYCHRIHTDFQRESGIL